MKSEEDRSERMKRMRVGLTGLAVVLVLVMLATAVLTGISPVESGGNAALASERAKSGDEPLADLGVAPGASDNGAAAAPPANAVGE